MKTIRKCYLSIARCFFVAVCMVVLVCAGAMAHAQVGANIGGTVQDPSGAAIPSATVTILNTSNNVSQAVKTGADGNYRAVNLQPAPYVITVTASGFATLKKNVVLLVGADLQVNFSASVSSVQSVEVSGPSENVVETTVSQPSSVITDVQIAQLPVLNRDFMALAETMPGAAQTANLAVTQNFIVAKFAGPADQRNGYTTVLDGQSIDDAIWGSPVINETQDTVQEFRVYRDQYDAQYGGAMDAVVNVVSKSGTDHLHGSAYYFGRDQALNAISYFATTKPPYNLLRAGATVGGRIPWAGRSHFFASYENLNIKTAFIEALPASNPFATEENGNYPFTQTENTFDTKLDHQFAKHSVWVRYAYDNQFIPTGGPLNSAASVISGDTSDVLAAEDDWTVTPSIVNTFGFQYLYQFQNNLPVNNDVTVVYPDFTFGRAYTDPQYFPRTNLGLYDTVFINKAKHNIEFGGTATRAFSQYGSNFYSVGEFVFTTNSPFSATNSATWPSEFIQETPGNFHNPEGWLDGFVQDNYSPTKRLHFNLGLRYDFTTNMRDNGFYTNALNNPALAGIQNFVSPHRGNEWSNWGPRLGVAYDLAGNGKIVLKAGYGRYVTRNRQWFEEQTEQMLSGASVFITNPMQLQNYPNITAVLNGETLSQYVASGGARSGAMLANNFRVPVSNNYTVGFDWQINSNTVLTANYVADLSQDEIGSMDPNQPNGPITASNPRPVAHFSQIEEVTNGGWASFKAFEVQLRTKVPGFDTISASYTYSKSLMDAVTFFSTYYFVNNYAVNPTDTPQIFSLTFNTVPLPWKIVWSGIFSASSGGPETVAAGIDLRGTTEPTAGQLPAGLEQTVGRGDVTQQLQIMNAYRANPCSFAAAGVTCTQKAITPAITASEIAPQPVIDFDTRLTKAISLRKDKQQLSLFFEAYNTFNHVTRFGGTGTLTTADALQKTSALPMRQLQWGARFTF
jgi:hypothetical protein